MRFIDLFAGIGGFRYGLERCNRGITKTPNNENRQKQPDNNGGDGERRRSNSYTCVWSNEWDKYATQIYAKNFEKTPGKRNKGSWPNSSDLNRKPRALRGSKPTYGCVDTRDIRTVKSSEIPDHDLLVGGFPCQSFSIAGKRRGFNDTRGTLFFDIARILAEKKPRLCLLENVKGLLSHDNGRTFKTIITTLTELGYDLQWQVLNSKNFGVPQNRERVFIIGNLRGQPRPKVFPITGNDSQNNEVYKREEQTASTVNATYSRNQSDSQYVEVIKATAGLSDAWRVKGIDGNSVTLKGLGGGLGAKTGLYMVDNNLNNMVSYTNGKESKLDDRTLESEKELRKEIELLRKMQKEEADRFTSQERELARQQGRKFGRDLQELPLPTSQSDKDLQIKGVQREDEEVRILREARTEIQEIRKPISDKTEPTHQFRIRRLTPVECERLQGFPDGWTEGISDTQRYKCLGNAVTTNVVTYLGKLLLT